MKNKMKNTYLILCLILISCASYKGKDKFKPQIKIIENSYKVEDRNPKSILFVFDVISCLGDFYMDLAKEIKERFKNSDTKVEFQFLINTTIGAEDIPKNKYSKNDFELVCFVEILNMKTWDNDLRNVKKGKQNYDLNFLFKKSKTEEKIGMIKLNVNSYYKIFTQNKNSSKLIRELIAD